MINNIKIAAYQTTWLLRIKPIQVVHFIPEDKPKYLLINEHFAFNAMVASLYDKNFLLSDADIALWNKFVNHLIYHFRHRTFDPQALELMLQAIKISAIFRESI